MTKEEAEKKLAEHENKPIGFCPIINAECRLDCVCYIPACTASISSYEPLFTVYNEYCNSPLVTGIVEYNGR
jgi:hypothetical protein